MNYEVELRQAQGGPIAVVHRRACQDEFSRVVPAACGEVWNFVRAAGIPNPSRHVAVYLGGLITVEVGVKVAAPFQSDGDVFCSTTPVGLVATTVHLGPYQQLGGAHNAIRQ